MAAGKSTPEPRGPAAGDEMLRHVQSRTARLAGGRNYRAFWRPVALVGLIGWTVVVPMLIGIALGAWIDRTWPSRYSWTLMLLTAGLGLGCYTAWMRVQDAQREGKRKDRP